MVVSIFYLAYATRNKILRCIGSFGFNNVWKLAPWMCYQSNLLHSSYWTKSEPIYLTDENRYILDHSASDKNIVLVLSGYDG